MPIVKLDDGSGDTLSVFQLENGYNLPSFPVMFGPGGEEGKEILSMKDWKCRADDILILAYPKAGTHWLWEVISMLVNGSADRINLIKEVSMLEFVSQEQFGNIKSPRVLNTHLLLDYIPLDYIKLKCKMVYILRNPKDLCVSYYNHHKKLKMYEYDGKFEDYVHRFFEGKFDYGSWFDYSLHLEDVRAKYPDVPFHIMFYEDMKENPIESISKLSKFLELKCSPELVEEIAAECDFDKMKKEKDTLEDTDEWKNEKPEMYRKGQVGDWKNWFTVALNEEFDAVYAKKMKDYKRTFRYTLP